MEYFLVGVNVIFRYSQLTTRSKEKLIQGFGWQRAMPSSGSRWSRLDIAFK